METITHNTSKTRLDPFLAVLVSSLLGSHPAQTKLNIINVILDRADQPLPHQELLFGIFTVPVLFERIENHTSRNRKVSRIQLTVQV